MTTPSEPGGEERFEPLPSAPALSEPEAAPGAPAPRAVNISFWLWMVTVALAIFAVVAILTFNSDAITNGVRDSFKNGGKAYTEDDVLKTAKALKTFSALLNGLFVVAYVLFAMAFRGGKNWGRIGITIAGALNLLLVIITILSGGANVISLFELLIMAVAIYLLYRPESRQFFASGKALR
jgi:hypothetical protein